LPPRKVGGIGRVTDKILQAFGITTVGELYEQRALVKLLFPPASAMFLLHASVGCSTSDDKISDDQDETLTQKGISRERTFQSGKPWNEVLAKLDDIARLLANDMQRKGLWARNLCVKVKLHTFDSLTRSHTMPHGVYLHDYDEIFKHAHNLLCQIKGSFKGPEFSIRLLGIRCSGLLTEDDKKSFKETTLEYFLDKSPRSQATVRRACSPLKESNELRSTKQTSLELVLPAAGKQPSSIQSPSAQDNEMLADKMDATGHVYCPLCQKMFSATANAKLNRHIDACLNSASIREAVRETEVNLKSPPTKHTTKRSSLDYFLQDTNR
jgi:DNA polymerase kappa